MEKYNVIIDATAQDDLEEIFMYIADGLLEPQIAKRTINDILEVIRGLCYMPERFPVYISENWCDNKVHCKNAKNFMVFYRVVKDSMTVLVFHVVHGGRDISKVLEHK